jgi:hypothetical protein
VKARTVARYGAAYALVAALALPLGWALAQRHDAPASARGPVSLGAVAPAASSKPVKDDPPKAFTMSGAVAGLVPGRMVTLPVMVSNPNNQSIKILTITVAAGDASAACPARGNLSVPDYDSTRPGATAYVVPGRGTATVPLSIRLVDAANRDQSACKRVTFPLSYSGTAMQWGN